MRKVETVVNKDAGQPVSYRVRFRYGVSPRTGKPRQTSERFPLTAKGKRDAEQFVKWLDALGAQGALEQLYAAEQQAAVPPLDDVAADHIKHLTGITDGTRLSYTRLWARTWATELGHLPANRVTADDVRNAVNALGRHYSRKSLENQRGLLSAVLGRCIEEGYLHKNPAKGVRLPRGEEAERVEMRILTPEEFAHIVDAVPANYAPLIRFLGATGCRWGEAVALEVRDVVLPNVRIRRALKWSPDNNRKVGPTKTRKSNRTVALPRELHEEMRALCAGKAKDALVFTAPRGGQVLHRTFWSRVWLPAVKGVEEPRPRIHDLRHSHAAWLLAAGVPIHIVQARLGHESIKTTVDTYGGLLPDAQMLAANAAALVFEQRPALEA